MEQLTLYIELLLIASLVFFAGSLFVLLVYNIFAARKLFLEKKLLVFSGLLIGSIWSLRMAVGFYNVPGEGLTYTEEIFNSLVHALQTFSMDEDYTKYISDGRAMLASLGAEEGLINAYGLYAAVLNVIAPIAGGAILFEMLSSIFPRLRLAVISLFFWKAIYFFSELNDRSLSLAKSIRKEKRNIFLRPTIVFTDVYIDREEEKSAERLLSAKQMGAICISNDLTHMNIRKFGQKRFFLIDENEINNLRTLTILSDQKHCHLVKKSNIYLFSQDDIHSLVEEGVRAQLKENIAEESEKPLIKPVKGYRNLVCNLLTEMPLYEPLIDQKDTKELNVTIFGTGYIGTEMFLTTYWCGQLLNHQLCINLVSKETEKQFEARITNMNPDILNSSISDKNPENHNEMLKVYPDQEVYADPYMKYRYFEMDVYREDLQSKMEMPLKTDGFKLSDSDYIVVALGSDEENLTAANKIKQCIATAHLKEPKKRTVIAYVVYNQELCRLLNQEMESHREAIETNGVYMFAFGSLEEVYSYKNIFMEDLKNPARQIGNVYDAIAEKSTKKTLVDRSRDEYDYWSNIGRAIHMNYKVFSAGMITKSVFHKDYTGKEIEEAWKNYKQMLKKNEDQELINRLAWLEHRRWNAFLRSKGFQCPEKEEYDAYREKTGAHKNLNLKLHPCLVECDMKGMRTDILDKTEPEAGYDMLDCVTIYVRQKMPQKSDFKKYDYPICDFEKKGN